MHPILRSSKNPDEVSRTVKGGMITILGAVVAIATAFGEASLLSQPQIQKIAELAGTATSGATIAAGALIQLYGVLAKVVNEFSELKI